MEESKNLVDIVTIKQHKIYILHNTQSQCMKEVYTMHAMLPEETIKGNLIQLILLSKKAAKQTRQLAGEKYSSYSFELTKFFGSQYF